MSETPETPETLRQYVTRRTDELLATYGRADATARGVGTATGYDLIDLARAERPEIVDNPQQRNAVRLVAAERILEWYTTLATVSIEQMCETVEQRGAALDRKADDGRRPNA